MQANYEKHVIVYVSGHTVEKGTAGHTHVMEVIRRLRKRGHEVRLVAVDYRGERPTVARRVAAILGVQLRAAFRLIASKLSGERSVAYVRYHPLMPLPTIAAKLLRVPALLEVNGRPDDFTELWAPSKFVAGVISHTIKASLRAASSIIVVAEGLSQYLRDNFELQKTPVHVVHNGVNTDLFRPLSRAESRRKLGLRQDVRIVTYVGALASPRGLDTFLQAWRSLVSNYRHGLEALVVGGGATRNDIEKVLVEQGFDKQIKLVGQVPAEEVPDYICSADVCVAPYANCLSNASGQSPLKVYEYLACARPAVASDFPWTSEILREGPCGLTTEPGNPVALSQALLTLLENPAEAEQMGRRGRELVEKRFTWDITIDKIVDIMTEMTTGKKGC